MVSLGFISMSNNPIWECGTKKFDIEKVNVPELHFIFLNESFASWFVARPEVSPNYVLHGQRSPVQMTQNIRIMKTLPNKIVLSLEH